MTRQIARLAALRVAELQRIVKALQRHPDLARRLELVLSVPGIGERTAIAIVLRMPELGRIGREAAAALARLAPFDHDSGRQRALRHIAGGRARLRGSLYAAALPAACHWNPALKALYARLIDAGKPHKLALVACPESCSSTPTRSSSAAHHGPKSQPRINGCYACWLNANHYIASGKRTMNPSRFGMCTLGNVSAFIVSLSPMSLFSARI